MGDRQLCLSEVLDDYQRGSEAERNEFSRRFEAFAKEHPEHAELLTELREWLFSRIRTRFEIVVTSNGSADALLKAIRAELAETEAELADLMARENEHPVEDV